MAFGPYIFDTELTGFDGEIVEAAWLRLGAAEDLVGTPALIRPNIEDAWCSRFNPSVAMTYGALAVHHILPTELEDCAPSSSFSLPEDCGYLIGHSIDCDWVAAGSPPHVKRICTHAIAQWLWPDATGYSQSALIYMVEGATAATRRMLANAHSALTDTRMNHLLLLHILRLNPAIQTWPQLWEYSERCRIPRTCPIKRYAGVLLADLDGGFIDWCLRQDWIDPYFRKGLIEVLEARHARVAVDDDFEGDVTRHVGNGGW